MLLSPWLCSSPERNVTGSEKVRIPDPVNWYRAYRTPPTLGRAQSLCPVNDRRDGAKPCFSFGPPSLPCAPEYLINTVSAAHTPPAFNIQDAHHATTPLLPVPHPRSVAHEPLREPYWLICGGSDEREVWTSPNPSPNYTLITCQGTTATSQPGTLCG